ncbi:hypothetical protein LBW59_22550 [Ralstonia solanacearum]|uniref:DUF4435 domain-containing protein n=1 Tax=Ralstonia solanacearum TaxID=305 RepID=A0AAW5ZV82_RALSL|nr:hypothetical protein [Ralstonia solanacearum]MDB0573533.1 hypothetical protein [Ralstonia solanacearum]
MPANIESFDNFDSDLQIAAHQTGLVRVILEGKSDVDLFGKYWFGSMRETFDFLEASQLVNGSGCTAVRAAVHHSQTVDHVPAIGIIDRDSLFREQRWELLFEVDEAEFAANLQTAEIYVASLWEIEAYMLEPDLLAKWVSGSHRTPPGPQAECESALVRTLSECDFLLEIASFFAAAHAEGQSISEGYFRGVSLAAAKSTCAEKLAKLSTESQSVAARVDALVATVRGSRPDGDADQLRFLLRYVDTKRLIIRLFQSLKVHDGSHWTMPHMQALSNRRPAEFEAFLKTVERRYVA